MSGLGSVLHRWIGHRCDGLDSATWIGVWRPRALLIQKCGIFVKYDRVHTMIWLTLLTRVGLDLYARFVVVSCGNVLEYAVKFTRVGFVCRSWRVVTVFVVLVEMILFTEKEKEK